LEKDLESLCTTMEEDREQFKAKHSFAYNSEAFS
jgi:hypothetical protein